MEATAQIEGTLVGHRLSSYGEFEDGKGRIVPGGTTRRLYLVGRFDEAPSEVKVKDPAIFDSCVGAGQFATVRLTCSVFARSNKVELTALRLDHVEPMAKAVKAA